MKKFALFIILCMLMVAFNDVSIEAKNKTEEKEKKIVLDSTISKKLYRIQFDEKVSIDSGELLEVLKPFENDFSELVFSLDAGKDIFTIGYYKGDMNSDLSYGLGKILTAALELKQEIKTNENLSDENEIEISKIRLKTLTVFCEKDIIDKRISGINHIEGYDILINHRGKESSQNVSDCKGNRTYPINGSYHYPVTTTFGYDVYWHNQINNSTTMCSHSISEPHLGDGNNRYASGYQWFPNQLGVIFTEDQSPNVNRTKLWYKYNQSNLSNLNITNDLNNNEALELEVVYYDYNSSSEPWSSKGNAFQYMSGVTWTTNQPNSYLDTTLFDDDNEVSLCVGIDDTSALSANTYYYWQIDSLKGDKTCNYPNDGRFKVVAQRSYKFAGSGTYAVFAEEHEPIRKLGVPYNYNWVPASQSAWVYAAGLAGGFFSFNSSTSPIQ